MSSTKAMGTKRRLRSVQSVNDVHPYQSWDLRSGSMNSKSNFTNNNASSNEDDLFYAKCYSSMKLDFHRSQFDYNKNVAPPVQQPYSCTVEVKSNGAANTQNNNNCNSCSNSVYGSTLYSNSNNKKAELFSNQASISSLYRSTPHLNYGANSYFGWHNRCGTLPRLTKPDIGSLAGELASHQHRAAPVSTGTGGVPLNGKYATIERGQTFGPVEHRGSLTNSVVESLSSNFGQSVLISVRKNRLKFCLSLSIAVIVGAVLVALGVAVYSQVTAESSVVKLVRQYQGYFTITSGQYSTFDRDVLNRNSEAFNRLAAIFTKKIDAIFRDTNLVRVYEGSEILSFRFPIATSTMEVHFVVKFKVDADVQIQNLLAAFEDGVKRHVGGSFNDVTIDIGSLTLENQRIDKNRNGASTKKPL